MLSETATPIIAIDDVELLRSSGFRLGPLRLQIASGERVALIGPNGAGKTTALRLIAGVARPDRGIVYLAGSPVHRLARDAVARQVAVVPQALQLSFAFTVAEVVGLGRTAHRGQRLGPDSDQDAIARAMAQAGVSAFAGRIFNQLSAGEQQRAILAMALAQQPRVLLLDEPTAHLDARAQLDALEIVRNLNRTGQVTVVAAIHDLNLAAQYFSRIVLMAEGGIVADGPPAVVLRQDILDQIFGHSLQVMPHPLSPGPLIVYRPAPDR